jgi:spoIIIJ-associated protein
MIKETLEQLLIKLETEYSEIIVEEGDDKTFKVEIKSDEASILIGHHGETISSLQHLLKVLCWAKTKFNEEFNIIIDVDGYRKKEEENIINLAERKVDFVRKTRRAQSLPPMYPYFRRVVHMHLMEPAFDDVETISEGEGELRHIIIKSK